MRTRRLLAAAGMGAWWVCSACQPHKAPPAPPTAQDVAAVQEEAQREIAEARIEASKDVRSAVKTGGDSHDVARAKAVAAYDVAMVKADGDHKVAAETCATLQPAMVQACKDQADADYETAKATAKVARTSHSQ